MDISLTFHAFILPDKAYCVEAGKPNPAEVAFFKLSDPNFVVSSTMYTSTTVLGDGFMVRCCLDNASLFRRVYELLDLPSLDCMKKEKADYPSAYSASMGNR